MLEHPAPRVRHIGVPGARFPAREPILTSIQSEIPRLRGRLGVNLRKIDRGWTGDVTLPTGVTGRFGLGAVRIALQPGRNLIA